MASVLRPDGTMLHYEDFNFAFPWEERGAPVVLVHGLGYNWTLWVKQLAWLVPSRRVIAVDARGSGQSRPVAQEWSTRDMAADVHTVADAPAGIPEAFQMQQQQELHLINTVSVSETAHRRMEKAFASRNQHLKQWLIAMIERMDTDSYRSQANATFAFNVWDRLQEITTPTMLVWGAEDAIIPVPMGLAMHQVLPGSTLRVVEGCGHFVNLEAPEAFHAILAEVLGLPTPTSGAATSVSQPE